MQPKEMSTDEYMKLVGMGSVGNGRNKKVVSRRKVMNLEEMENRRWVGY